MLSLLLLVGAQAPAGTDALDAAYRQVVTQCAPRSAEVPLSLYPADRVYLPDIRALETSLPFWNAMGVVYLRQRLASANLRFERYCVAHLLADAEANSGKMP